MKVSDRQWSVGDKLKVVSTGKSGQVVKCQHREVLCAFECCNGWLNGDTEVELVAFKLPPITERHTIEQRAVRLAEVYGRAWEKAWTDLTLEKGPRGIDGNRAAAHDIAMLLVKRELEAGDG